jgi:hypothetical protein
MYNSLPQYVKEDTYEAIIWAKEYMTQIEGSGHSFQIYGGFNGTVHCSFAKPEWNADHSSRSMDTGAEAIVMAVCEYVNGL